jgi:SAM-dependent methyltransferase
MSVFSPATALQEPDRRPTRARDVIWFNWPVFAAAAAAVAAGIVVLAVFSPPLVVSLLVAVGIAVGAVWLVAATSAAWWVFEGSQLTRWWWLPGVLADPSAPWVNITTGFDDTTPSLARLLPFASGAAIDLFDESVAHDRSILRARASRPPVPSAFRVRAGPLPLETASAGAAFLLMAAHEIRDPDRRDALFHELARVLTADGRLVLVEHLRNAPNAIAFGPGVFHFFPRSAWLEAATRAGLRLVEERRMTPLVSAFVFAPTAPSAA